MFRDIKTAESSFVWFHRVLDSTVPILTLIVATHLNSVAWHDRYTIMGILGVLFFILSAQAMEHILIGEIAHPSTGLNLF